MRYRGRVRNGVVVLENARTLQDGTDVYVEPVESEHPRPGSASAVLRQAGIWADQAEEVDRLLNDLRELKRAETTRQQNESKERL